MKNLKQKQIENNEYINDNFKKKNSNYEIKKMVVNKKSLKIDFVNYATLRMSQEDFITKKQLKMSFVSNQDKKDFKNARVIKIKIIKIKESFRKYRIKTNKGNFDIIFGE